MPATGEERMLDRLAKALESLGPLDFANYQHRQTVARACLEALREPTEEMKDAGVAMALNVTVSGAGSWTAYIDGLWKQMVDAALRDPAPNLTRVMRENGE